MSSILVAAMCRSARRSRSSAAVTTAVALVCATSTTNGLALTEPVSALHRDPSGEQWIPVISRKSLKAHKSKDKLASTPTLGDAPLSSLGQALPSTTQPRADPPKSTWASVASAPPPVKLTKLNLETKHTRQLPKLARGPGWTQPFSMPRTAKPEMISAAVPQALMQEEPVEVAKVVTETVETVDGIQCKELTPVTEVKEDSDYEEPPAEVMPQTTARRVSWSDEQDQPLTQVKLIENCLLDKWDWSRCTDLSTREGKRTLAAATAWYGMLAIGMCVGSYAGIF